MAKRKKELDDDLLTGGAGISSSSKDKSKDKVLFQINKKSLRLPKRTKKIITSVVAIVVVAAILVAYVATGAVRKGFVSYMGVPAQYFTGMTVSNGENTAKIKVSTFNYYFAMTYNNLSSTKEQYEQYGMDPAQYNLDVDFDIPLSKQTTIKKDENGKEVKDKNGKAITITWYEEVKNRVYDSIESTYMYYLEAVAANDNKEPEITEEQKTELNDTIKEYRDAASGYGYTLSAYLVRVMGKGVTESVFKKEAKISYIAQNYTEGLSEELSSKEYTTEDYNKYKKDNLDDLVSVNIRAFECDSEDDAKSFKKALKSDGSNFTELASKYSSTDFYKEAYKSDGYSTKLGITKPALKNQGSAIAAANKDDNTKYPGLDWLFSEKRKAGDIKQYSTSVVYVLRPSQLAKTQTVNVRHILISLITEEDDDTDPKDATNKQWKAAYKKADDLLKEWKNGEKTSESFGDLAVENSTDTGSAENGGLYENVYPGQMVDSFSYWCFGGERKAGDTAIVKSDYGYHIIYFIKKTGTPAWQYTAQQALAAEDSENEVEKLEKAYKLDVKWLGSRYFEKDTDIDP